MTWLLLTLLAFAPDPSAGGAPAPQPGVTVDQAATIGEDGKALPTEPPEGVELEPKVGGFFQMLDVGWTGAIIALVVAGGIGGYLWYNKSS